MSHLIEGLEVDVDWPESILPENWRERDDPDGGNEIAIENDEYVPSPNYVTSVLGFDPDEFLTEDEDQTVANEEIELESL